MAISPPRIETNRGSKKRSDFSGLSGYDLDLAGKDGGIELGKLCVVMKKRYLEVSSWPIIGEIKKIDSQEFCTTSPVPEGRESVQWFPCWLRTMYIKMRMVFCMFNGF